MSSLTKLELLDLGNNTVVGPIPTWIGSLRELQEIDLTNNRMSGQIPSQIGSLTKLVSLELAFNNLASAIPQSITSLPLLEYLEVKNNLLAGSLPAFSGSSLQTVVLVSLEPLQQRAPSTENLTSHQPNHLGQQRRSLWEPGNSVLVCIQVHQKIFLYVSTRLGLLRYASPRYCISPVCSRFAGELCNLAGTLPSSLFAHSSLELLKLESVGLTGTIPTGIGLMTNLTSLELGENSLVGNIPVQVQRLPNLTNIEVYRNLLSGPHPTFSSNPGKLKSIDLVSAYSLARTRSFYE